jgi:hypothetical protein
LERIVEEQFEIEDYILYVKPALAFKTIWAQGGIFYTHQLYCGP